MDASAWMLQPLSPLNVNILPGVASPLLSAASFNGVTNSQLDKVNFIGAFGADNWTAGWTNFDPQNAEY